MDGGWGGGEHGDAGAGGPPPAAVAAPPRGIDRRFSPAATTPPASSRLGAKMRDAGDLARLSGKLVVVIAETLQPAHVSLGWAERGSGWRDQPWDQG